MLIENEFPSKLFSPVGTICLFLYAVPTELKIDNIIGEPISYQHMLEENCPNYLVFVL